jgi:hypothetical protein
VAVRLGKIVDRKDDVNVVAVLAEDEIADFPERLLVLVSRRLQLERFVAVRI